MGEPIIKHSNRPRCLVTCRYISNHWHSLQQGFLVHTHIKQGWRGSCALRFFIQIKQMSYCISSNFLARCTYLGLFLGDGGLSGVGGGLQVRKTQKLNYNLWRKTRPRFVKNTEGEVQNYAIYMHPYLVWTASRLLITTIRIFISQAMFLHYLHYSM